MKNLNSQWFYEKKMNTKSFNAAQRSVIIKALRDFAAFRESLQRELCALNAHNTGCNDEQVKAIRNAFPMIDEVYDIRKQMQAIRQEYFSHFAIVKEFQCAGKYLFRIMAKVPANHNIEEKQKYVVRIFQDGSTYAFLPDKPSKFLESTYIANTENLKHIKKSLVHLSKMEANSEAIEILTKGA